MSIITTFSWLSGEIQRLERVAKVLISSCKSLKEEFVFCAQWQEELYHFHYHHSNYDQTFQVGNGNVGRTDFPKKRFVIGTSGTRLSILHKNTHKPLLATMAASALRTLARVTMETGTTV